MSTGISKLRLVIAGLEVYVYSSTGVSDSERDVVAFFLLHGRYDSAENIDSLARSMVEQTKNMKRNLLVVTFDQRNHGKRLVEPKANDGWTQDGGEKHNEHHALDMYSIQTGTARDVTMLIDFLPSFLYPDHDAHPIVEWGVAGISLGGHATWITLAHDKRVTTGIPIIGCPDYIRLMTIRAEQNGVDLKGLYFPKSFKETVERLDPASLVLRGENLFLGKRVLVLSGEEDNLVPWDASQRFVEELDVGEKGIKKVSLYKGVGHECTKEMEREMAEFIAEYSLLR